MRKITTLFIITLLFLGISRWTEATSFTYEADQLPWDDGWSIGNYVSNKHIASIENDDAKSVLHINGQGLALWIYKSWDVVPNEWSNSATFVFKNIESSIRLGAYFGISMIDSDGNKYYQFYSIMDSSVAAFPNGPSHSIDTTSGYNTYTTILSKGIATLWVNGELAFSNPANTGLYNGVNGVQFGAGSSGKIGNVLWDYVSAEQFISEPTTIEATIDIDPDTLNLKSRGKWITFYIEFPDDYDVNDIDVDSIRLEGVMEVQHSDVQDGILMVKFNREYIILYIELLLDELEITPPTDVSLTMTGDMDGTPFEGSDTIRVMKKGK